MAEREKSMTERVGWSLAEITGALGAFVYAVQAQWFPAILGAALAVFSHNRAQS